MSFSFNIFRRQAARVVFLFCFGISGTRGVQAQGRAIEFSEPADSKAAPSVSELGSKPSSLPNLEDRAFKPNSFSSSINAPSNMKPLGPMPGNSFLRENSRLDQNKNWRIMTSDEMMQSLILRNVYKQSRPGADVNDLGPGASVESYSMQMSRRNGLTNRLGGYDLRGNSREMNRLGNASDALKPDDSSATPVGRRTSSGSLLNSDLNASRPSSAGCPSR